MTKEFASELSSRMTKLDISQRGLGEASGVDHSSISRLLTGKRNAGPQVAERLAAGLHVAPDQTARFLLLAAGHNGEFIQGVMQVPQEATPPARPLSIPIVRRTG